MNVARESGRLIEVRDYVPDELLDRSQGCFEADHNE